MGRVRIMVRVRVRARARVRARVRAGVRARVRERVAHDERMSSYSPKRSHPRARVEGDSLRRLG